MILVTGVTGHLGKEVLNILLKKTAPSNIAVMARDTAKISDLKDSGIDIRQGDYDKYDSLVKAFKGIEKLYFVSGSDVVNRIQQHTNVVKAAKEAGVKHVVYTSFQRKNETDSSPLGIVAKGHVITDNLLNESGLNYTIMKHSLYMEMIPVFVGGEQVLQTGTIFQPAGNGKVAYATRTDMAEAAASVITGTGHENKSYEIAGPVAYSYADIATIISDLSGKKINYVAAEQDDFRKELAKVGVPDGEIGFIISFGEAIKQGEFDTTNITLEKLIGKKPTSAEEFLKSVYGK